MSNSNCLFLVWGLCNGARFNFNVSRQILQTAHGGKRKKQTESHEMETAPASNAPNAVWVTLTKKPWQNLPSRYCAFGNTVSPFRCRASVFSKEQFSESFNWTTGVRKPTENSSTNIRICRFGVMIAGFCNVVIFKIHWKYLSKVEIMYWGALCKRRNLLLSLCSQFWKAAE